jgi:two-component system, response regulator FlrC
MRLLIIGSLQGHMTTAGKIAIERGARVSHIEDVESALNALRNGQGADLIMIDIKANVVQLILALKTERFHVPVVACGIGNDTHGAVQAIKAGAKEYLPLPADSKLIAAVLAAVTEEANNVVYRDPVMVRTMALAEQIASSDATVLITGESGTGKEVMARHVHNKSRRAAQKFVSINCAAIPEHLLESELFGHEKGAFTGAVARRIGKFEEADGGTLLLDEISEMHPSLQAKLLRAIQERIIDRVGGTTPVKVNIRLIATSNRNMEDAVRAGQFREDLYYRLNVVNIRLPALRERPTDIEMLANHFIKKYSEANDLPIKKLADEARLKLQGHVWRGNVRELENTMHRAVLLSTGPSISGEAVQLNMAMPGYGAVAVDNTLASNIPAKLVSAATPNPAQGTDTTALIGRTVADVERDLILQTLNHCLGNRTHAANILGISIRTLRNKLKQYSDAGVPLPAAEAS